MELTEQEFDSGFLDSGCWCPAEFRACRARLGWSTVKLRRELVSRLGELGIPSLGTISTQWAQDGGPGPKSPVVVRTLAEIFGCSVRVLLCPTLPVQALTELQPSQRDIMAALGIVNYLARLEYASRFDGDQDSR